jgi:hypothetical protein
MEQGSLTYAQAERAFAELERLRKAGQLSPAEYTARLDALRVLDEHGRTWMLQEGTGQWFVYDNDAWVAATPPQRQNVAQQASPLATEDAGPTPTPRRKGRLWLALGGAALALLAIAAAIVLHQRDAQGEPLRHAPAPCSIEHRVLDPDRLDLISSLSDDQRTVLALNGPPQAFTLAYDPQSGAVIEEWSYYTLGQQLTFLDGAYQGGIEAPPPQIQPGVAIPAPAMYPWEILQEPRPACVVKMAGPALFVTSALVLPGWNDGTEVARLWMLAEGGTMITVDGRLALVSIDPGVALDLEEYGVSGLFIGTLGEGAERVGAILSPGEGMGKYHLSLSPRGQGTTRVGTEVILDLEGYPLAGEYTFGGNARASVVDRDGFGVPAQASGSISITSVGDAFEIRLDARVDNRAYQISGMVANGLWRSWDRLPGLVLGETWPPVTRRTGATPPTAFPTRVAEAPPTQEQPTATSQVTATEAMPTQAPSTPTVPAMIAEPETPAGWRPLLYDTFDTNVNRWSTEPGEGEYVRWNAELAQGEYALWAERISGERPWVRQSIGVPVGTRFHISIETTRAGGGSSDCGLYFAGSGGANETFFHVSDYAGAFRIRYSGEQLPWTSSAAIRSSDVNRLSAMGDGSRIVFYINGEQVEVLDGTELDVQRVGVVATVGSNTPTVCTLDNVKIHVE